MLNNNKVAITVDVESEKLHSNFCPISVYKNLKKTEKIINKIEKKYGKKIPITWFIRCDDTVSKNLGHSGSFLSYISKFIITRDKKGDRRLSINERYKTKEEFLNKVKQEAEKLLDQNYILAEDVGIVISACEERYDAIVSGELKN